MTGASAPRVVWAAVGAVEVAQIAATSWRQWPASVPLRATASRAEAVAAARQLAVTAGAGTVLKLEVDDTHEPAMIAFEAEYREAASELEIRDVERVLRVEVPMPWRTYWRSPAWLRRGWMQGGAYVSLYTPSETLAYMRDWEVDRRGMFLLGTDGGGEMITVDMRDPGMPVSLTPFISTGWEDSIAQGMSLAGFVAALEDGTFDLRFS